MKNPQHPNRLITRLICCVVFWSCQSINQSIKQGATIQCLSSPPHDMKTRVAKLLISCRKQVMSDESRDSHHLHTYTRAHTHTNTNVHRAYYLILGFCVRVPEWRIAQIEYTAAYFLSCAKNVCCNTCYYIIIRM